MLFMMAFPVINHPDNLLQGECDHLITYNVAAVAHQKDFRQNPQLGVLG